MVKISIEGNIGSGKTQILKRLEQDNYRVHYNNSQSYEELTHKFYNDIKRYSLAYHMALLKATAIDKEEITRTTSNVPQDVVIYENSPYTIKNIHCELHCLEPSEYNVYNTYHTHHGWVPDIMIYLFCHPLTCHERIINTDLKHLIDVDYLTGLHVKYEIICNEMNCPVKLFKVNSHEDIDSVYKNIRAIIDTNGDITGT